MKDFGDLVELAINSIGKPLVALLAALALIYFLAGVLKYIQSAGDEGKRREGYLMILYGLIGLFVMVTVWGLVRVLENTFLLDNTPVTTGGSSGGGAPWPAHPDNASNPNADLFPSTFPPFPTGGGDQ